MYLEAGLRGGEGAISGANGYFVHGMINGGAEKGSRGIVKVFV